MSSEEIDRLLKYKSQGEWINSAKQFLEVTHVSDSFLNKTSPFFKFPKWVSKPKANTNFYNDTSKSFEQKRDLNTATAKQLQEINGIGEYYSERIIKLRNTFIGGFIEDIQLQDVNWLTHWLLKK